MDLNKTRAEDKNEQVPRREREKKKEKEKEKEKERKGRKEGGFGALLRVREREIRKRKCDGTSGKPSCRFFFSFLLRFVFIGSSPASPESLGDAVRNRSVLSLK